MLGERIFRSWVLLFGVLPIDYDDLTLIALEPGRGFHERSRMLSMRVWEHERTLEPDGEGGCRVRDRLSLRAARCPAWARCSSASSARPSATATGGYARRFG